MEDTIFIIISSMDGSNPSCAWRLVTCPITHIPITVAVPFKALNLQDPMRTAALPVSLRHKVDKSDVTVISPAPSERSSAHLTARRQI